MPAYVEYISATQVNFLLPSSAAAGIADVDLITPTGVMSSTLEIDALAPGLFCYSVKGVLYPALVNASESGVVYVAGHFDTADGVAPDSPAPTTKRRPSS